MNAGQMTLATFNKEESNQEERVRGNGCHQSQTPDEDVGKHDYTPRERERERERKRVKPLTGLETRDRC